MRLLFLLALLAPAALASAQDWKLKYPTVAMSAVSSESQGATEVRFKDFARMFKERLGPELKIYTASDYAGTIQALTAGQIHFASLGPAAYAAAWIDSGGAIEPLAAATEADGVVGYHSHLIVKADGPYQKLADLKGKTLAWADPNSTSGYLIPLVALRAAGTDAERHFGRTIFSGGHEQSVLGVVKGQFDAAFIYGARDPAARGILRAMADRGLADPKQLRVIWRSSVIPNSPITVRKELPADMKRDIQKLFIEVQSIDPAMARTLARGDTQGYVEVTHAMYQPVLDAVLEQRANRRKQQ